MFNVIVSGCAGFIGSHLTERLLDQNYKVTGIDNFHPYYDKKLKENNLKNFIEHPHFKFIEGSILEHSDISKLPRDANQVYHFAAIAGVRNSIEHPEEYFKINVEGTKNLIQQFKNAKFIFASSSSVYGNLDEKEFPVSENHTLNPISPYGESKKEAEKTCIDFANKNGTKVAILRFYTVYGPRQRPDEAIMKFIRLADDEKPISIYGDGNKERDYTYVSDIVNGTILAAQKGNGIYNLGTGRPITINHMVSTIEKSLGKRIEKKHVPSPLGDVEKTHADISKAKKELGYTPLINFEKGIETTVQWCRENCVV